MAKTESLAAEEIAALKQTFGRVGSALDFYAETATRNAGEKSNAASGEVSSARTKLFMEAHTLLRSVRGPVDMVYSHVEAVSKSYPFEIQA